jgi:hypothetical protein
MQLGKALLQHGSVPPAMIHVSKRSNRKITVPRRDKLATYLETPKEQSARLIAAKTDLKANIFR